MIIIALPLVLLLSVAFGIALGSIPVVNGYLHWSIYMVVPITGLTFTIGMGYIQTRVLRFLRVWPGFFVSTAAMLAGPLGFLGIEYGIFRQRAAPAAAAYGRRLSFPEYLHARVSRSTEGEAFLGSRSYMRSIGKIKTSAATNRRNFYLDLGFAAIAGIAAMSVIRNNHRYCPDCRRYLTPRKLTPRFLGDNPNGAGKRFDAIQQAAKENHFAQVNQLIAGLPAATNAHLVRLHLVQHTCPRCQAKAYTGRLEKKNDEDEWEEVSGSSFVSEVTHRPSRAASSSRQPSAEGRDVPSGAGANTPSPQPLEAKPSLPDAGRKIAGPKTWTAPENITLRRRFPAATPVSSGNDQRTPSHPV